MILVTLKSKWHKKNKGAIHMGKHLGRRPETILMALDVFIQTLRAQATSRVNLEL